MVKLRRMLFILVELCIFLTHGNGAPVKTNSLKQADAIDYLKRFNYISNTASNKNVPPEILAKAVRDAMARALDIWAKETQLKLNYVEKQSEKADIKINFFAGQHGDSTPFDGPEGVLAHAQLPTIGNVHFDDEENWLLGTEAENNGIDLFNIAVHEFGHALGLDHSDNPDAVMYPIYSYSSNLVLNQDDIDGIQALYGKKPRKGKNSGKSGKTGKNGKTGKPRKQQKKNRA
ncbi:hypothetical protein CHS0354_027299 [Potamilus streckersoni]|uniref:Peptidase metallopeptidase domain-containing protein n=1 Tax=Potamilus streckersoni TaxID=2493646 RepID=A0AAE0T9F0_9BIVA|nr:hypothetical protein CHS0354_027299 [Potamilus streckersoni]